MHGQRSGFYSKSWNFVLGRTVRYIPYHTSSVRIRRTALYGHRCTIPYRVTTLQWDFTGTGSGIETANLAQNHYLVESRKQVFGFNSHGKHRNMHFMEIHMTLIFLKHNPTCIFLWSMFLFPLKSISSPLSPHGAST